MLPSFTGIYLVLLGFTGFFHRVGHLPTGFHGVTSVPLAIYTVLMVLPSFTSILPSFQWFYLVSTGLSSFQPVFTGFYRVLRRILIFIVKALEDVNIFG